MRRINEMSRLKEIFWKYCEILSKDIFHTARQILDPSNKFDHFSRSKLWLGIIVTLKMAITAIQHFTHNL